MFTLVLWNGILDGFSKFWIYENCIIIWDFGLLLKNYIMHWLSMRGNNFITCWAYEETISSHTESTPNEFSRMLSKCSNFDSFFLMDNQFLCMLSIRGNHNPYQNQHSKYAEHTRNVFHDWLSIRGNDFIAGWAYKEIISSLAEHTWKCLKVKYISAESYTILDSFSAKKYLKKCHACLLLNCYATC
jgi:hypothetical protein